MYKFADAITGTTTAYEERRSVHPTFTGDCYINFGYLFWFPALMWGAAISFVHIKAKTNAFWNLLAGSTSIYFVVLFCRGSMYQASFQVIICAIFLTFALFILYVPYLNRYRISQSVQEYK